MIFPFSYWGSNPLNNAVQTLQLSENFSAWFSAWTGVVQTLQLTENFTGYFNAIWAAVVQTLQLFEDFNSW